MYIIVIVVVSVHAYNIGAVKYDWKILYVVAKFVEKELYKIKNKKHSWTPTLLTGY